MFMALKGKSIGETGVQLRGTFEAFESLIVITLEGERVADCTPGLRRIVVEFDDFMGQEGQVDSVFLMPEDGGINFHIFETRGCHGFYAGETFLGFSVRGLLVKSATYLC